MSYDRRSGDKRRKQKKFEAAKIKKSDEGKAWRKSNVARTGADNEKLEADKPVVVEEVSAYDLEVLPDMDDDR